MTPGFLGPCDPLGMIANQAKDGKQQVRQAQSRKSTRAVYNYR